MLSTVLIIDKRNELSLKYKRSIDEAEINTVIAHSLQDGIKYIQSLEPEMIIVSDSIEESLADFCKKIRALTYNTRPVIVALSKSAETEDKINILENGADDFISEPVNIEEFKTRIKAHIRRDVESNLDDITLLPNKKYVKKALKRLLSSENHGALLIEIRNIDDYKAVYTELAADKLIQTFTAIAKSALEENDFFGQLDETNFVVITNKYSLEKLSAFLTFAFDTVVPKFYAEKDVKRGYSVIKGTRSAGIRAEFVSLAIGGILEGFNSIPNENIFINKLTEIKNLSKIPNGSNFVIERPKLTAPDSVKNSVNKNIYIKEKDEALNYLIRTTLELQGYSVQDSMDKENDCRPAIVIIDSGNDLKELEHIKQIKQQSDFSKTVFIVTTTVHDKAAVLDSGADLYLPKPYEISDLIKWVEYFFKKLG